MVISAAQQLRVLLKIDNSTCIVFLEVSAPRWTQFKICVEATLTVVTVPHRREVHHITQLEGCDICLTVPKVRGFTVYHRLVVAILHVLSAETQGIKRTPLVTHTERSCIVGMGLAHHFAGKDVTCATEGCGHEQIWGEAIISDCFLTLQPHAEVQACNTKTRHIRIAWFSKQPCTRSRASQQLGCTCDTNRCAALASQPIFLNSLRVTVLVDTTELETSRQVQPEP